MNELPRDHSWALGPEVSNTHQSMWIDDDFPRFMGMGALRPGVHLYVDGQKVSEGDELARIRIELSERVRRRKEAAMREFAQLSSQHPVTGYDRNVMQQWIDAGAAGRRPELSFEISGRFKSDRQLAEEEAARAWLARKREKELDAARRALRSKKQKRSEALAPRLAAWNAEHPEETGKREKRKALVAERRRLEAAERAAEIRRRSMIVAIENKILQGGKAAILALSEEEFDLWVDEIATVDQLEAFGADLLKDGKRLLGLEPVDLEPSPWERFLKLIASNL